MIKKLLPFIIGLGILGLVAWAHAAPFYSFQVGTGASSGTFLETNGTTSTWSTIPPSVSTTTINQVNGPTFTFSIVNTSTQSSITTSSANLFLNLLYLTSSSQITITSTGTIIFASNNISQFINNVPYLTTSTGLTTANFSSNNISQWNNNSGYITSSSISFNGLVSSTFNVTGTSGDISSTISGATTTLDLSNVTSSGSCTNCNVTVDTKGRVTTYSSGSSGANVAGVQSNVQFNDAGALAANSSFSYTSSTHVLVTNGTTTPGAYLSSFGTSTVFSFTGAVASWTVPVGIYGVRINTLGAGTVACTYNGDGGSATGTLSVTPGTVYWYVVGGEENGTTGGFGGGGTGGGTGCGGGGMSWFGSSSTFSTSTAIIVGAGAGGRSNSANGNGGNGGGTTGSAGTNVGSGTGGGGGTQTAGGTATGGNGATNGAAGQGGNGGAASGGGGGGGGGGYFGGGGGSAADTGDNGGGGGGSSYMSPILSNTSTAASSNTATGTITLTQFTALTTAGNDNAFSVTVPNGSTASSTATVVFASPVFNNPPSCWAFPSNATNTALEITPATSSVAILWQNALSSNQTFNGGCHGY